MTQPVYALNLFNISNKDKYIWQLFYKLEDFRPILK
jgi:hypothetical protein